MSTGQDALWMFPYHGDGCRHGISESLRGRFAGVGSYAVAEPGSKSSERVMRVGVELHASLARWALTDPRCGEGGSGCLPFSPAPVPRAPAPDFERGDSREQADFPAEQPSSGQDAWVPSAHAYPCWPRCPLGSPRQGP